jgi:hypothetical protein
MTETEYKALTQPEKWKLISEYQKKTKTWRLDENDQDDMKLFYEWLIKN